MIKWILLGLGLLLLLLLVAPIGVEVVYREGKLNGKVWILGIPIRLKAGQSAKKAKKGKKAKAEKPAKQKEPAPAKEKRKLLIGDLLQTLNDILPEVGRLLGHTTRHITIRRIAAVIPVSGEDAAQVGIRYGQYNALLYTIYTWFCSHMRLRRWLVSLNPDFTGEFPADFWLELCISASPAVLLWGVLRFTLRGGLILYRDLLRDNGSKRGKQKIRHGATAGQTNK